MIMNHIQLAVLSALLLSPVANAQTNKSADKTVRAQTSVRKEIDPETLKRRTIALSLLESLAIEARSYRDEPLRARVQGRIADAIWDQDKENARSLFRRAWAVAEEVEKDAAKSAANSVPGRAPVARPVRPRTNLRREI